MQNRPPSTTSSQRPRRLPHSVLMGGDEELGSLYRGVSPGRWQPLAPRPTSVQTTWRKQKSCTQVASMDGLPAGTGDSVQPGYAGVDLTAKDVVAPVKFQAQPSRPTSSEHFTASQLSGCHGIVFSSSGYTRAAKEFASAAGVPAGHVRSAYAAIQAHSEAAEALFGSRLPRLPQGEMVHHSAGKRRRFQRTPPTVVAAG